ncbi:jerky protein homolog-like [Stegodyphus dumicola]|uniref:jerky protein homolog-like n=1 Tax=Stegodyphus dumicola TaxID=202533 RepID=UPI0015A83818|nr:jerky protein homolog-like [Stegodyphus dumicola]
MKLDALKRLDKGGNVNKITRDLGVERTTLIEWKKKRSEIESWYVKRAYTDSLKERKNMKGDEYEKVSEALYLWFRQQRKQGTPISGPVLQEQALKFYDEFQGEPGFTASADEAARRRNECERQNFIICCTFPCPVLCYKWVE